MAGAMCINVMDSSQEVCCPIRPGITNWNKTFISLCLFRLAPSVPSAPSSNSSRQAASSSMEQQAAGEQQQVSSSKQQQVAGKQQGSSR